MKAGETNVLRLLQGSKVFVIPSFQRRYSWRSRQWELLWADLLRECDVDHSKDSQELAGHFLGSIVLHPASGPASTLMRHLVIDGQQRLTTLIILLAAIRDVRSELDPTWDPGTYNSQYLTNPFNDDNPDRLLPTRLDREAYVKTVRGDQPTEGIGQAYVWFYKRIRESINRGGPDLERLGTTLLLHMLLVEINTKQGDSVNNIFNTLNSKGMPLSSSDLVRNEILLHVGERASESAYEHFWLPMELSLVRVTPSRVDDRAFVTFLWSREVVKDPSVTRQELFSAFETRLRGVLSGRSAADREALAMRTFEELFEDHKLFLILNDPMADPDGDFRVGIPLRKALALLGAWGSEPTKPFALWIIKHAASGDIQESDAVAAVEILMSYLIRRALAGVPTNLLNRLLTPIPHDLEASLGTSSVAGALASKLGRKGYYWLRDSEVRTAAVGQPIFISAKRNVKFLLQQLELLLPGRESSDTTATQIEHVMPQSISDEWRSYFKTSGIEIDEALSLTHTLGNLTLTENNQGMGNAFFIKKRDEYYSNSSLRLNRSLAELNSYLPSDIRGRTVALVDLLLARFPGPPERSAGADEDDSFATSGSSIQDRLEAALQSMPEGDWTSDVELVTYLGAQEDLVRQATLGLSPTLARLVRTTSGSVPSWYPAPLRMAVVAQSPEVLPMDGFTSTLALQQLAEVSTSGDQGESSELDMYVEEL